ncbi:MAG: hypothetical protein RIC16_17335 [Rhodospirillales bacterium]
MFGSDLSTIAFFMGAVGMGLGGVSLLVALEVSRRGQEQLARHTEDMGKMLASRLEKQDRQVASVVDRLNERIADVENVAGQQKTILMEVSSSVENRLASHEAMLDEKLKAFRDKMATVERNQDRQAKSVTTLKTAMRGLVEPSPAGPPAPPADIPMRGSSPSIATAPMPRQPVITDVGQIEEPTS